MAVKRDKLQASAQKHVRKGNWERAIRDYELIVEQEPDDVRTMLKIADLNVKLGKFEVALVGYQKVAYHYAKDDIYDKAVAVYKQALRVEPNNARLHRDLGEAYYRHGRLKDAIRAFHQAQKLFREAGESAEQRDVLERMVLIDPEDVGLKIQLAERYEKDELRVEALKNFREGAETLYEEGRLDEYVQVAERIIFLEPSEVELRKRVVHMCSERGDYKHALKHLQHLFKEQSDDVEILEALGNTFAKLGNTDKAILVYTELARAFHHGGRKPRAIETYYKVLALDPNHAEARAAVGKRDRLDSEPGVVDTNSLEEPQQTDALDGIEFLDDDDDDEVEEFEFVEDSEPIQIEAAPEEDSFLFGEDELGGMGSEILANIDENPATGTGWEEPATALHSNSLEEISAFDLEPVTLTASEIRQTLQETEVFLKYGLLDRAFEVLTRIIETAPNNIPAREYMVTYNDKVKDLDGAAHQLFELARLTRSSPGRAAEYLRRAMDYINPAIVVAKAGELGVSLDEPKSDDRIEELRPDFIEEVSDGIEEVSVAKQKSVVEFLPLDDEEELDFEFEDNGAHTVDIPADFDRIPEPEVEEGILDMTDFIMDVEETSEAIADELGFRDAFDIDDVEFDEGELSVLDDKASEVFEFNLSGDDADHMFDELFGLDDGSVDNANLTEVAEIDFYLEQGLLSEAEDALERFAIAHPDHDAISKRANRIADMKGQSLSVNPFGASSLSGKFNPEISIAEASIAIEINNSNLELGKTYKDMGLFKDAIEEFKHALEDPDASAEALLHIALCEIELGESSSAEDILNTLSNDGSAPERIRKQAEDRLQALIRERAS